MTTPVKDPWQALRRYTAARIGLGRSGNSMPTAELLRFGIAHAQARDAVHRALDAVPLQAGIESLGHASLLVHSQAQDRSAYLLRPDLGRRLDESSVVRLAAHAAGDCDLCFVVADGLSATAVQGHALPLLRETLPRLAGLSVAPIVVAAQARVALGDEIGALLRARLAVVLIGERPGLSSPDSLGVYLTYGSRVGSTDAERNCISNIRPEGLSCEAAAVRLAWLLAESLRLRLSGVVLKDGSDSPALQTGP